MRTKYCAACGTRNELQVHHLFHKAWGGGDEETNLVTLCRVCHLRAHGKQSHIDPPVKVGLSPKARVIVGAAMLAAAFWFSPTYETLVAAGVGFGLVVAWGVAGALVDGLFGKRRYW